MNLHSGSMMVMGGFLDTVIATAALIDRAGGSSFEVGYLDDDVPSDQARWWASASWQGRKVMVDDHQSPTAAALALAERVLDGAACRCGRMVTLEDEKPGCRWTLKGQRWEPGCDAPPITIKGAKRGDLAAMHRALRNRRR